jgi:hypothetical protein
MKKKPEVKYFVSLYGRNTNQSYPVDDPWRALRTGGRREGSCTSVGRGSTYRGNRVGRVLSLFSICRNWDSPNTSSAGECATPPPPPPPGFGHTRWRERGWESPNSDEGTYTVVLCKYTYFVVRSEEY